MAKFRVVALTILLVVLVCFIPLVYREVDRKIRVLSWNSVPARLPSNGNEHLVTMGIRNAKGNEKGCSVERDFRSYAQCCEDHWIYERYFAHPPLCNGTYVEIGAHDGVQMSNTKFFEDALGWSGMLIEANPFRFKRLQKNRPNSLTRGLAICKEGVKKIKFTADAGGISGVVSYLTETLIKKFKIRANKTIEIPCKPMGKLLREAGISGIDFFSLDVEGAEMLILETMDWTIPVKVFLVETYWIDKKAAIEFFKGKGYKPVKRKGGCAVNTVFEREDLS